MTTELTLLLDVCVFQFANAEDVCAGRSRGEVKKPETINRTPAEKDGLFARRSSAPRRTGRHQVVQGVK